MGHGTDIGPDQVAAWEDQLAEVNNNLERLQQQQREEAELAAAIERVRRGEARVPDALSVPASTTSPQTDEIARAMQNAKDDYRRWGRPSDGEQYLHLHQLHRESLAEDVKWSNDDLYRDQPTYGTLSPGIDIETTVKPPNSPDLKNWTEAGGTYGVDPNGTWWFRNARGVLVRYSNGEPDFLGAGRVRAQYSGMTGDRNIDRRIANRQHPIPEGTELHHTSRNVGQAVDEEIHRQFRHRGGVAGLKRIPLRLPPPTRTPPPPRGGR